jgi:rod shape-determining protein MreC
MSTGELMLKRPHYIALGIVGLLVVILLHLPQQTAARLKLAIGGLFLPLFGLASGTQQAAGKAGDSAVPRAQLLRELEQLRTENQDLKVQLQKSADARGENARLRALLNFPKPASGRLKAARVVGRDPANWWRAVFIDLGSRDGVQVDMPVLTSDGLAGRIFATGLTSSQVVLLGDPNCRAAAKIPETGEAGIITPGVGGPADSGIVTLSYLSRMTAPKAGQTIVSSDLEIRPGQTVLSSGLGGVFPAGILIGQVIDTRSSGYGLYTEARVKLAANLNSLEAVWVLLP